MSRSSLDASQTHEKSQPLAARRRDGTGVSGESAAGLGMFLKRRERTVWLTMVPDLR